MQRLTKKVQKIGNGAHVYLPKELIGQKVTIQPVQKSIPDIKAEALELLKPYLVHIQGIYLCGSYARGEQSVDSDIDLVVVTDKDITIPAKIREYEIVSGSVDQIQNTLEHNAISILPMLKESKVILNESLLYQLQKNKLTKKNVKWYIETTESSLAIVKDWISDKDKKSIKPIVYSLIMRLRGLYILTSILHNNEYSNKLFESMVKKYVTSMGKLYLIYRQHRDSKDVAGEIVEYSDIEKLYSYAFQYYLKVKKVWEKLT